MDRRFVASAGVILLLGAMASGVESQGTTRTQDIMPDLLAEVRGLRAAMEQMAAAGPRVQLALGRLQLQEQRLAAAIARLEGTRDRLASVQREAEERREQFDAVTRALQEGKTEAPEERAAQEQMLRHFKGETTRRATEIQRLTAEEAALASDVSADQVRWSEINQRLEELERSLGR